MYRLTLKVMIPAFLQNCALAQGNKPAIKVNVVGWGGPSAMVLLLHAWYNLIKINSTSKLSKAQNGFRRRAFTYNFIKHFINVNLETLEDCVRGELIIKNHITCINRTIIKMGVHSCNVIYLFLWKTFSEELRYCI